MKYLFLSNSKVLKDFIINRELENYKSYLDYYEILAPEDQDLNTFFKNITFISKLTKNNKYDMIFIKYDKQINNLIFLRNFLNINGEMQININNITEEEIKLLLPYFEETEKINNSIFFINYSETKKEKKSLKIGTEKSIVNKLIIRNHNINDIKAKEIQNCLEIDKAKKISLIDHIEYEINNLHLSENLLKFTKRIMDDFNSDRFSTVANSVKVFKVTKNIISEKYTHFTVSQAFLKMYEILETFNFFDLKKRNHSSFHFCEAPGQFIMSIKYYLEIKNSNNKLDWYAQSMNFKKNGNKDYFGDDYGLMRDNPTRWVFGADDSGDVTKDIVIKSYREFSKNAQLITSDCGLGSPTYHDMTYQDKRMAYINYCQLLAILYNLKKGGHFVAKVFLPQSVDYIVSINYIISKHFKNFYVYKPYLNPGSSEVYLIGKDYTPLSDELMNYLFEKKKNLKLESGFVKIPKTWLTNYEQIFIKLIEFNLDSIRNNIYFYKNQKELKKISKEEIKKILKDNAYFWINKFNFKVAEEKDLFNLFD